MIKPVIKYTLNNLGFDTARIGRVVRETRVARMLMYSRNWHLVSSPTKRRNFVLRTVREFNPNLIDGKTVGTTRAATIWEGTGRFEWLDHANVDPAFELVHLPRAIVNPAWNYFLREYLEVSRSDPTLGEYAIDRYYQHRFAEAREAFREYCRDAIIKIRDVFEIDILIMPKVNDDWTIDFINCAKSIGLKVVIDDREGTISPKRLEAVPPRLRDLMRVEFDRLYVHNDTHRELFVRAGLPSKKIFVNGAPQSDYWHRPDQWKTRSQIHSKLRDDRFLILFFSFGPRTGMNFYFGEEKRNWLTLGEDYHQVIFELLKNYGDRIQIVKKSGGKPLRDQFPGYEAFLEKSKPYISHSNYIELDGTYSSFDLLNNADTVLGFQTSGLIEAMFKNMPIVYGAWGELFEDTKDTLLPFHNFSGITYSDSRTKLFSDLEQLIVNHVNEIDDKDAICSRVAFREKYFARADGNVSRRILDGARELAGS